jgi:hypothetical protein
MPSQKTAIATSSGTYRKRCGTFGSAARIIAMKPEINEMVVNALGSQINLLLGFFTDSSIGARVVSVGSWGGVV